jgi:phosphatidylinositol alpha-1,6-mannosyltransferase
VLPNTVREQFVPEGDRASAKKKYGLTGKRVLLTVSRLAKSERYKGHDRIIGILPKILQKTDNLVYVIAGDGDMRRELEELVRQKNLEDFVHFAGQVGISELPTLYRAADVFVMPSSGEGFGIVFLEAMASGTPVIAGNSDGAHDPLQDGNLGVLSDEKELAVEIQRLLESPHCCGVSRADDRKLGQSVGRFFGRTVFENLVQKATEWFEHTSYSDPRLNS